MTGSDDPERPWGSPPTEPPWDMGADQPESPPVKPRSSPAGRPPLAKETLPPAPKPVRSKGTTALGCLLLLAIIAIVGLIWLGSQGGGGSTGPVASTWTLDNAKTTMGSVGFAGQSSPLADGRPRWLMSGPDAASFEAIGSEAALSEVTLSLGVADNGSDSNSSKALVTFLSTWAPDASSFVKDSLTRSLVSDVDTSQTFGGYSVRVQSIGVGDGVLLIVSVERT